MAVQPPPLPLSALPQKSFYHQAATWSLLAPFVCAGVNIMINASGVMSQATTRLEIFVPAIFTAFFLLSGVVFGIIALFGIRRYGKAGILWKALSGILIFVLLVLVSVPNFLRARELARERYQQQYGHLPP